MRTCIARSRLLSFILVKRNEKWYIKSYRKIRQSEEHQRRSGIGDEDMATTRDILLVGSVRLANAEDVFRTVASILGDKVRRC